MQHFSGCPLCGQVFEHDGRAFVLTIDRQQRRVCSPCVGKFGLKAAAEVQIPSQPMPAQKPNGGMDHSSTATV